MNTAAIIAVLVSWLAIFIVWTRGFFGNKRNAAVPKAAAQWLVNIVLVVGFVLLAWTLWSALLSGRAPSSATLGTLGILASLFGGALAIWARVILGRNWSGVVVTVKAGHRLVTAGPYAYIRHPIYAGLLMMCLGSILLAPSFGTGVGSLLMLTVFLVRIRGEERLMRTAFKDNHENYRMRVKKLFPMVW